MKLSIITLHSIYNPGSVFQAFALQKYLLSEGYDVEIIDYRPSYSTIGKNKLKGYLRKILFFKNQYILKQKYEEFINSTMILTNKRYHTFRELEQNPPIADVYMSGSDQLWNMDYDCGRDLSYYLGFVEKNKKKIAYSTSIGKKNIPSEEMNLIISRVKDFSSISLREESSCEQLAVRLNKEIAWVCDPVFLISVEVYRKMITRIIKEKYITVYLSDKGDLLNAVINDIRKKTDYKVILIGGNRTRCSCDRHVKDMGPYDFLSLIYYSEIVVSSSFHATAFSLIFNKKFGVILPPKNGERIESILNLCGLKSHLIGSINDISIIYEDVDYSKINIALTDFVDKSKSVLRNSIEY